jgi:hypothetical protein
MFQNTPTKVDATVSTYEPCTKDASTLTVDMTRVDACVSMDKPPRTCDISTLALELTIVCAACTQTETRYVMTTNQSVKIKSWLF